MQIEEFNQYVKDHIKEYLPRNMRLQRFLSRKLQKAMTVC